MKDKNKKKLSEQSQSKERPKKKRHEKSNDNLDVAENNENNTASEKEKTSKRSDIELSNYIQPNYLNSQPIFNLQQHLIPWTTTENHIWLDGPNKYKELQSADSVRTDMDFATPFLPYTPYTLYPLGSSRARDERIHPVLKYNFGTCIWLDGPDKYKLVQDQTVKPIAPGPVAIAPRPVTIAPQPISNSPNEIKPTSQDLDQHNEYHSHIWLDGVNKNKEIEPAEFAKTDIVFATPFLPYVPAQNIQPRKTCDAKPSKAPPVQYNFGTCIWLDGPLKQTASNPLAVSSQNNVKRVTLLVEKPTITLFRDGSNINTNENSHHTTKTQTAHSNKYTS